MERRTVLRRGAVAASTVFAGCSGITSSGGVDLVIRNRDDQGHEYGITADGDFEARETAGELGPDESNTVSGFLPRLDYTHVTALDIAIDGSDAREVDVVIESKRDVLVDVLGPTNVQLRPSEILSPSPETDG